VDWAAWSAFVRDLAARNRSRDLIWDIWNEPDNPYFWTGSEAQFHELYRLAYVAIRREVGPGATIAGPSVGSFRWDWLTRLLEYCRGADCDVNALTWHEIPGGRGVTAITQHARRARTWLLRNSAYAALGLRELVVGEYVGEGDAPYAGELLAYLVQLERAGVTRAAHACWRDPSGTDNCLTETLDGLLDATTMRPRAPLWALRWYVRGAGSRVHSSSTDPALVVVASRAPARERAEIVLGYADTHDGPLPCVTDVVIHIAGLGRLRFLPPGRQPRISAYKVRSQGETPTSPVRGSAPEILRVAGDRLVLRVRDLGLHDTLLLQLSRPLTPKRARR